MQIHFTTNAKHISRCYRAVERFFVFEFTVREKGRGYIICPISSYPLKKKISLSVYGDMAAREPTFSLPPLF